MEEDLNALPITEWEGFFSPWHSQFSHESWKVTRISPFIADTPCHYSWKNTNLWCDGTRDNQTRKWHTPEYSHNVKSWALRHVNAVIKQGVAVYMALTFKQKVTYTFYHNVFYKKKYQLTQKKTTCHHMNNLNTQNLLSLKEMKTCNSVRIHRTDSNQFMS